MPLNTTPQDRLPVVSRSKGSDYTLRNSQEKKIQAGHGWAKIRSKFLGDSRRRIVTKKPKVRGQDLTKLKSICTARGPLDERKRPALRMQNKYLQSRKSQGIHLQNTQRACAAVREIEEIVSLGLQRQRRAGL